MLSSINEPEDNGLADSISWIVISDELDFLLMFITVADLC